MKKSLARRVRIIPTSVLLFAAACSGSGSSTAQPGPVSGAESLAVSLSQWAVTPTLTTVAAGSVTFTVTNDGTIPHEFVVLQTETPAGDFPIDTFEGEPERFNEDTAGTNVGETGDMDAGTTKTLTIDLAPGHYALVCNLPTHYGLGMHTDFTVS